MKILFVGDLTRGHNARSLVEGFRNLGIEIRTLDTSSYMRTGIGSREWFNHKLAQGPSKKWRRHFTNQIREVTLGWNPDVMFCINTIHIPQEYLVGINCRQRVHLSFDDVSNPANLTRDYLEHENSWDLIFTNKIFNIKELENRCRAQVKYFENAYDEKIHFSNVPFESRKWDVGFIGAHRPDRHELPKSLNSIGLRSSLIAGPRWARYYPLGYKEIDFLPELLDRKYTSTGNQIKLGLCLLNSENRDRITVRSYELPALGQLVLGLQTDQHLQLLDDKKEAFWFQTLSELLFFVKDLKYREREFAQVASAGRRRIVTGNNTYTDRARLMCNEF